jgi:hypothetical protein
LLTNSLPGNSTADKIEPFVIQYVAELQRFVFHGKQYMTLRDFVSDRAYGNIFRIPLPMARESDSVSYYDTAKLSEELSGMSVQ